MPNLNIIGNGFDLYHGLPSSYYYFACYLLHKNEQVYNDWADMYGFYSNRGLDGEDEKRIEDAGYWSNFEKHLGFLSPNWVENSLLDDLGLEDPEAVELPIDFPNHVDTMKEMLREWVEETVDTKSNFEIIQTLLDNQKIKLSKLDTFISFNYTHTLEEVYNIHNVFHIHGESRFYIEPFSDLLRRDLVIGHGNKKEIDTLEQKIQYYQKHSYDQSARNRLQEYSFEYQILRELKKPVDKCKRDLKAFLEKLPNPEFISCYGLSFGDVDLPYIKLIRKKWPYSRWRFSYYSNGDKKNIANTVKVLGLSEKEYELFELNNPSSKIIQDKLVEHNHIKKYTCIKI